MLVGRDGTIHAAWSWGSRRHIKYAAVTEDWIRGPRVSRGVGDDGIHFRLG